MRLSAYYPEIFRAVRDFLVHKSRRMYVVRQDPDDPQKVRLSYKRGGPEDGFPYPVMTHPTSTVVDRPGGPATGAGVVVEDRHGDGNWAVWAAIPAENNDTGGSTSGYIPGDRWGTGPLHSGKVEHYPPEAGDNIIIEYRPPDYSPTLTLSDGGGLTAVPHRYGFAYHMTLEMVWTQPGPELPIIPTTGQATVTIEWSSDPYVGDEIDLIGIVRSIDGAPFELIHTDASGTGSFIDDGVSGSAYDPHGYLFSSTSGTPCPIVLPCDNPNAASGLMAGLVNFNRNNGWADEAASDVSGVDLGDLLWPIDIAEMGSDQFHQATIVTKDVSDYTLLFDLYTNMRRRWSGSFTVAGDVPYTHADWIGSLNLKGSVLFGHEFPFYTESVPNGDTFQQFGDSVVFQSTTTTSDPYFARKHGTYYIYDYNVSIDTNSGSDGANLFVRGDTVLDGDLSVGGAMTGDRGAGHIAGNQTVDSGVNFALNTTTGTQWGTGTSEKQGWWGATPVVQQSITGALSAIADTDTKDVLTSIVAMLSTTGLASDSTT